MFNELRWFGNHTFLHLVCVDLKKKTTWEHAKAHRADERDDDEQAFQSIPALA